MGIRVNQSFSSEPVRKYIYLFLIIVLLWFYLGPRGLWKEFRRIWSQRERVLRMLVVVIGLYLIYGIYTIYAQGTFFGLLSW